VNIVALFINQLNSRLDYPCPAVQLAIDEIAQSRWGGDRKLMLELLPTWRRDDLFTELQYWTEITIERATGIARDRWYQYFDATFIGG
jgi:hypothetical protein